MPEQIVGFVLFVDVNDRMIPYKTTDNRLVVFASHQSAFSLRGMLDVVSPVTKKEVKQICECHDYKSAYYPSEDEVEEFLRKKEESRHFEAQRQERVVVEQKRNVKRKASQSERKASQSDAKASQLSLW